jgi:hypothetical protein
MIWIFRERAELDAERHRHQRHFGVGNNTTFRPFVSVFSSRGTLGNSESSGSTGAVVGKSLGAHRMRLGAVPLGNHDFPPVLSPARRPRRPCP